MSNAKSVMYIREQWPSYGDMLQEDLVEIRDVFLTCRVCTEKFTWSAGEQIFYLKHKFSRPKRCKECRKDNVSAGTLLVVPEEKIEVILKNSEKVSQREKKQRTGTRTLKLSVEGNGKKKMIVVNRDFQAIKQAGAAKLGMNAKKDIKIQTKKGVLVTSNTLSLLEDGCILCFTIQK